MGWALGILPSLVLIASAASKFLTPGPQANEGLAHLGWNSEVMPVLGVIEIIGTILYLIPRTSLFGAVLLAGYLGGATATHVRVGDPFFAPVVIGVLLWTGLWLRESRLRVLTPLRQA